MNPARRAAPTRPFVAFAVTPWHALGVEAYVASRGAAVRASQSMVVLAPYPPAGHLVDESYLPRCVSLGVPIVHDDASVTFLDQAWAALRAVVFSGIGDPEVGCDIVGPRAPADLVLLAGSRLGWELRRARFVIVDEGIGSYTYQLRSKTNWAEQAPERSGWKRRLLRLLWRRLARWANRRPLEMRYVFDLNVGLRRLSPNPAVAPLYGEILRGMPRPPDLDGDPRPRALYLGETNAQEGWYPLDTERRLFHATIDQLVGKGYRVLVKPHPAEPVDKYREYLAGGEPDASSVRILHGGQPVELYAANLSPQRDIVVGVVTTALLTTGLLFGIRTYTAAPELLADYDLGPATPLARFFEEFSLLGGGVVSGSIATIPAAV